MYYYVLLWTGYEYYVCMDSLSYEDIEEARTKRAEKEAAKGKRGRKRKSAAPEADVPEPKAKVARMSDTQVAETVASESKSPVARMSERQVAENE